ncbi:MAG: hypothetical protein PHH14_02080 [Candidatus Margulisbacteria bacterium]|nr:hypothetical protein [Candidatus Margulisiibacteriota bacterium]
MTNDKLKMTNVGVPAAHYLNNVAKRLIHLTFVIGHLTLMVVLLTAAAYAETLPLEILPITTKVSSGTNVPTQLQSNIGGMSIGYVKVGTQDVFSLDWRPDFKIGPWGLGFDVNLGLGDNKPAGYENLVIRYAEYDDSKKGLRYGVLDNVTLGHGLIMSNYSTRLGNQVLLTNEQVGLKGYYDFERGVARVMGTKSNIYYARAEERINPVLTLGQYYVVDSTGRKVTLPGGTTQQYSPVSAIGVDATYQLPANWQAYAEAGQLMNYGNGVTAGLSWAYDAMVANLNFSAEYRMLDKGFVPSYFDVDYETNPVNLSSAEASGQAKNGYLAQLGVNALGLATLTAAYESYQGSNSTLTADLSAKLSDQVSLSGYYKQPNFVDYRSLTLEEGSILGADIAIKINPMTTLVTHYKKAWDPALGKVASTQYYEVVFSF